MAVVATHPMRSDLQWLRRGLAAAVVYLGASAAADAELAFDAPYSIAVANRPLGEVLEEIATDADMTVRWLDEGLAEESVSLQASDEPLIKALRRLLKEHNYVLYYDRSEGESKRIERILIVGRVQQIVSPASASEESSEAVGSGDEVVLTRDEQGHFLGRGTINGRPVEMLVDTGATLVAVSAELASELGLVRGDEQSVNTAAGTTQGFATTLANAELGGLQLGEVEAVILPNLAGRQVLLGMSFLRAFELNQRSDQLVIRPLNEELAEPELSPEEEVEASRSP